MSPPQAFIPAWEWARQEARSGFLLPDLRRHWRHWWQDVATTQQQQAMLDVGVTVTAQGRFIADLKSWANHEWPRHPQTATWLLLSLAREKPFRQWVEFAAYRTHEPLRWVNGIFLHDEAGGTARDVMPLSALLIPQLPQEPDSPVGHPLNFSLRGERAESAPQQAVEAVTDLLEQAGFNHLIRLWLWLGVKVPSLRSRWLLFAGWTLAVLLFAFLQWADPFQFFADDTLLLPVAISLFVIGLLLVILPTWNGWRAYRAAQREGRRWAALLADSRVCLVVGESQEADVGLPVHGPSFSVTLALSLLLALDETAPAQSWFWRRLVQRLTRLAHRLACTGSLVQAAAPHEESEAGFVSRLSRQFVGGWRLGVVRRLPDKLAAVLAASGCAQLLTPAEDEFGQTLRARLHRRTALWITGTAQAAEVSSLRVQPYRHLARLVFDLGDWRKSGAAMWLLSWVSVVVFTGRLLFYDLPPLVFVPPDPRLAPVSANFSEESPLGKFVLQIDSSDPERFAVLITSRVWANQPPKRFSADINMASLGTVAFDLLKRSAAPGAEFDGNVDLIRLRQFLGRELPPAMIEGETILRLANQHNRKAKKLW